MVDIPKNGEVLLYFSAPWCGPCKSFGPTLERVCEVGGLPVLKIDVDENADFVYAEQVRSVPMIKLYRDGVVVGSAVGAMTEGQLKDWLNEHV